MFASSSIFVGTLTTAEQTNARYRYIAVRHLQTGTLLDVGSVGNGQSRAERDGRRLTKSRFNARQMKGIMFQLDPGSVYAVVVVVVGVGRSWEFVFVCISIVSYEIYAAMGGVVTCVYGG